MKQSYVYNASYIRCRVLYSTLVQVVSSLQYHPHTIVLAQPKCRVAPGFAIQSSSFHPHRSNIAAAVSRSSSSNSNRSAKHRYPDHWEHSSSNFVGTPSSKYNSTASNTKMVTTSCACCCCRNVHSKKIVCT
mmetsp:Transcript_24691/g.68766  ORF Transcript_24691/g.68766 Transcript_24691/m.68766 type:complete len:132 (+) Transcript_24691:1-396(+)